MTNMYKDIVPGVSETVIINYGKNYKKEISFYAEDITSDTPYNYRERNFTPILGGTENVTKGKYVHREFSFTTTLYFPKDHPHEYDSIFKEIMSAPVLIQSRYMGGNNSIKALVTFQKSFPENSVNHMDLDVKIIEIPDSTISNIPGEEPFTVPAVKKVTVSKSKKKKCEKITLKNPLDGTTIKTEICETDDLTIKLPSSKKKSKKKTATKKSKVKKSKKK